MNREYSVEREAEPDVDWQPTPTAAPGRTSITAGMSAPTAPVASGIVGASDAEKQALAMELEAAISGTENRIDDLRDRIRRGAVKRGDVLPELRQLNRELVELNTRLANARRTKKLDDTQIEVLQERLGQLTNKLGAAQEEARAADLI